MKSFWSGFITFLLYSILCLFVLSYFFFNSNEPEEMEIPATETISNSSSINESDQGELTLEEGLERIKESESNEIIQKQDSVVIEDSKVEPTNTSSTITSNKNEVTDAVTSIYKPLTFSVYGDNNKVVVPCNLYALIYENRSKVKIPYGCINYGLEIKKILKENDKATLTITGYSAKEEDASLGKQRAEYIKKLLLGIGTDATRIKTNSSFQNIDFNNGVATGGVILRINNTTGLTSNSSSRNNIKEVAKPISRPTGLYGYKKMTSGFQGDYFYGNQAFTSYISKVKNYLAENGSKKVYVYLHTDSVGNAADNMAIAQSNANTAKRILTQSGIPASQIRTVAMGEKPADSTGSSKSIVITVK